LICPEQFGYAPVLSDAPSLAVRRVAIKYLGNASEFNRKNHLGLIR
jgi:hypothetical protein